MPTNDNHYYLGIDLGTTNSSMHWGAINPSTKRIDPQPLEFDQRKEDGTIGRRLLLPSYIWHQLGDSVPVVGEYARKQGLEAQPSRVARSVKNNMGRRDWFFEVDKKAYSAVDLSTILLQTMSSGINQRWGFPVNDVVITVPASFDGDMRKDTLTAAQNAGFKTFEKNQEPRNLLLDEPRAALYDFLNQQLAGYLPPGIYLDLSTPKIVLVFDLGGGTLDVSLHTVKQSTDVDEVGVDDLAISRYTQLGGGVFDNLIADELVRRFEERNRIRLADLAPTEQQQIRVKFEVLAEQAKQRLTNDIQHRINQGILEIPDDFYVDVQALFIYQTKGLVTKLSKGDFEKLINPLMAPSLNIAAAENFMDTSYSADNIIYPILDVLAKAKIKLGNVPKVDAVVLNGGMTRIHAIRERLQEFFGIRPITVLDPEHSVSRGATVYHYLLHRGWKPRQILAESIGVEASDDNGGSRIFNLVPAGTVLPFHYKFNNRFTIPYDGAQKITIPLFRGENSLPEPPNKKILERQFVFKTSQHQGTPIEVEISIDENKIVSFAAELPNGERAEVRVGVDQNEEGKVRQKVKITKKPVTPTGATHLPIQIEDFRRKYMELSTKWRETELKELGSKAVLAGNAPDLIKALLQDQVRFNRVGRQRMMYVLGEFAQRNPESELIPTIIDNCISTIKNWITNDKAYATVGRNAVVALGKIGSGIAESHLINALNDSRSYAIRGDILMALGKCSKTINAIQHIGKFIDSDRDGERIGTLWALGRLGSREHDPLFPIDCFNDLITIIGQHCFPSEEPHETARRMAIYALGEIGDRRQKLEHNDIVDHDNSEYIIMVIKRVLADARSSKAGAGLNDELRMLENMSSIALKQVQGETLTDDETRVLMSVRALMSISKTDN
jgi:molecular chaperone DnaK (HSP70)/HEAT repeat protein